MKTYISIDIDFFNDLLSDTVEDVLDRFFKSAVRKKIPIVAVMNHQQLTKFVDESNADTLINIDKHADIADSAVSQFNCGTWVSYIKWRHRGHYHWVHRHNVRDGECSWREPVFMTAGCSRERTRGYVTEWNRVSQRKVKSFPNTHTILRNCVAIGFVLSPFYADIQFEPVFRKLVRRYNMKYVKGVRGEDLACTKRRPPFSRRET